MTERLNGQEFADYVSKVFKEGITPGTDSETIIRDIETYLDTHSRLVKSYLVQRDTSITDPNILKLDVYIKDANPNPETGNENRCFKLELEKYSVSMDEIRFTA